MTFGDVLSEIRRCFCEFRRFLSEFRRFVSELLVNFGDFFKYCRGGQLPAGAFFFAQQHTSNFVEVYFCIFGDFEQTKQSRSEIPNNTAKPERLDLSYVSQNEGFGNYQNTHFLGWATATAATATAATTAEEFPGRLQPPSHHAQG